MIRSIVLDIETTGLFVDDGHRLISVGMVELVDGAPTGRELEVIANPGRDSDPAALATHKMTTDYLKGFPPFGPQAQAVRDFIGDAEVIITCRTSLRNGVSYTLDQAFLDAEFAAAGVTPLAAGQWVNVRRWSEALFGQDGARLDALLDRYGVGRAERDAQGHGALRDAKLLAAVYPRLRADHLAAKPPAPPRLRSFI